jgi:hypothetical protein
LADTMYVMQCVLYQGFILVAFYILLQPLHSGNSIWDDVVCIGCITAVRGYRPPLPMKSLHIYREFITYQMSTVSTQSDPLVDALILDLALSTSRSSPQLLSRHSLHIASILVSPAVYPLWRNIAFIIPLDFHSEHQSLCRSACGTVA